MKFSRLFLGDVKFQMRYGFYLLYAVVTLFYVIVLFQLPSDWKSPVGSLLLFTDPTVLGLIFSGAIVQFELSERTFESLSVAPIKASTYVTSKALSLAVLSTGSAAWIGAFSGSIEHWAAFLCAIFLGSIAFTLLGLIVAFRTHSLNRFFLSILPIMMLVMLPGVSRLFVSLPTFLVLHPGIAVMEVLLHSERIMLSLASLALWVVLLFFLASKIVYRRMKPMGGISS
jgi:fluoroquinolone transport system permease protein